MTAVRRPGALRLAPDERRRQLLDVACVEFAERGFYATSMDDLAAAAGVTKPVFYQHFESKRALFIAVLEDVGGRLLVELTAATASVETGRARVAEGFAAYFRFVVGDRAAFRLMFGASARNDAEFADVVDQVLDDAAEAVSTLIDIPGSPAHRLVLAHAVVGMAEGISRHALADPDPSRDPEQLAHWVGELAWFGLRGVRTDD
ncbi:MAG: TetR/AcrR family transcriptional regulator [Acidimicrobiia bacterium]